MSRPKLRNVAITCAVMATGVGSVRGQTVPYKTITNYQPYIFGYEPGDLRTVTAWYGERIALIVDNETNPAARHAPTMDRIVHTLDNIIHAYEDVTGVVPTLGHPLNGRIRIEVSPRIGGGLAGHGNYNYGVGDGHFEGDYNRVLQNNHAYAQVHFYELARNFWTADLNPRIDYATSVGPHDWGWWTVGFNNAMSALMPRTNIEGLDDMFYFNQTGRQFSDGMTAYLDTYINNPAYNWDNTWNVNRLPWNNNVSLNDLMTGLLIRLHDDHGGIRIMEGLYREIPKLPVLPNWPNDAAGARDNFYLAASRAADTDLRDYFTNTLKWPLSSGIRPFDDFTWTGASQSWNSPANWSSAHVAGAPDGAFDRVYFTGNANPNVDVNGNRTVRAIKFAGGATAAFTVGNSVSGARLVLGDGGNIIKEGSGNALNHTVSTPLTLEGDAHFANNNHWVHNANKLIISGDIAGGDKLRITGTGDGGVELSGNNADMTARITVDSGLLILGHNNALGTTSQITTINGGALWLGTNVVTPEHFVVAADSTQSSLGASGISGDIKVNRERTWTITNGGGNPLTLSGALTGTGSIRMLFGNTTLSGSDDNTLSGTITLASDSGNPAFNRLILAKTGGATAIAGSLHVRNRGTVILQGDDQIADSSAVTLDGPGTRLRLNGHSQTIGGLTGNGIVENESGAADTGTLTIQSAGSTTFSGIFRDGDADGTDGTLSLTKSGNGRFTLTGVSTHSGTTTVTGGVLAIGGNGSINHTDAVVVNGGTFLNNSSVAHSRSIVVNHGVIGGTGTYSGSVSLGSGHIVPGDGGAGVVTFIGGIALSSNSVLDFELGSPDGNNDRIDTTHSLTLDGILNVTDIGGFGPGDYVLFQGFSNVIDNGLTWGNMPSGHHYAISVNSGQVMLNVTPEPASVMLWTAAAGLVMQRRRRAA